ncbi:metallophosphoesterase [Sphingomonas sp. BGYR3]|uniref:metallophosphoesterase family protein n=1 Tax=Sphingomonas sp. BGYR3 TaxID=2975483 RepID=UPI0021A517BD|nr:metallophosphoesterase [Sphingomonas sp. BGYR3]MDG5487067.1 metallophosphoesterase [Sphingomonas sp. BGYR3]
MIRLFHVSDLHFGREDRVALDWFARAVAAEAPDAVVMTGDLTQSARSREFAAATEWLEGLGVPVTVEVGNHDLPMLNPVARMTMPYRRFLKLERLIERPLQIEGVAIVPLRTTARFQWRLNWAKGHVSRRHLAQAVAHLGTRPQGAVSLVTAHHPLVEAGTVMNARTRRGPEALAALARAGADAVLTGHVHDPFDIPYRLEGRTIRLIGAGTLSERLRSEPPSFNELRIDRGEIQSQIRRMT